MYLVFVQLATSVLVDGKHVRYVVQAIDAVQARPLPRRSKTNVRWEAIAIRHTVSHYVLWERLGTSLQVKVSHTRVIHVSKDITATLEAQETQCDYVLPDTFAPQERKEAVSIRVLMERTILSTVKSIPMRAVCVLQVDIAVKQPRIQRRVLAVVFVRKEPHHQISIRVLQGHLAIAQDSFKRWNVRFVKSPHIVPRKALRRRYVPQALTIQTREQQRYTNAWNVRRDGCVRVSEHQWFNSDVRWVIIVRKEQSFHSRVLRERIRIETISYVWRNALCVPNDMRVCLEREAMRRQCKCVRWVIIARIKPRMRHNSHVFLERIRVKQISQMTKSATFVRTECIVSAERIVSMEIVRRDITARKERLHRRNSRVPADISPRKQTSHTSTNAKNVRWERIVRKDRRHRYLAKEEPTRNCIRARTQDPVYGRRVCRVQLETIARYRLCDRFPVALECSHRQTQRNVFHVVLDAFVRVIRLHLFRWKWNSRVGNLPVFCTESVSMERIVRVERITSRTRKSTRVLWDTYAPRELLFRSHVLQERSIRSPDKTHWKIASRHPKECIVSLHRFYRRESVLRAFIVRVDRPLSINSHVLWERISIEQKERVSSIVPFALPGNTVHKRRRCHAHVPRDTIAPLAFPIRLCVRLEHSHRTSD